MSLDNESIGEMLNDFDKDSKALRNSIFKLAWFMRGSLSVDEAFTLGFNDREMIAKLIKDNLETTKETGLAFF